MTWLVDLFRSDAHSVAQAIVVLALVAAVGLGIGSLTVRGLGLGIAGVLFAGIGFGHFGFTIDHEVMEFAREFGLILFVYSIGVQVGPGFFASLRRNGLPLNLLAAAIVLLGAGLTVVIGLLFMGRDQFPAAVGLYSGATTNTPSLAAAQQALADLPGVSADARPLPGIGYAVAYPFGIIGIILTMLLIRGLFRVDVAAETAVVEKQGGGGVDVAPLATMNLEVTNPNLDGLPLSKVPTLSGSGVVISRLMHRGGDSSGGATAHPEVAGPAAALRIGDILHAVGPRERLDELRLVVGAESPVDLKALPSAITVRRLIVTRSAALGRAIGELDLRRYGANVTRVIRADVELPPTPGLRLQFGDQITVVGDDAAVARAAAEVGDSVKRLNHPQIVPIFVGIVLGVILGSVPIPVPGMPVPLRLGLAGGPLIAAIVLSRLGRVGPLVWHLPTSANLMLRELGIVLFLAAVGLRSGARFVETLTEGPGLAWMGYGAIITLVPLLIVSLFARVVMKLNFVSMCGLLAGSMTDPPALAFAGTITGSDAPGISYATVYPLVMILRVVCAQAMVIAVLA
jgi:putative transport protein